jgi:hypothetical protein
MFRVLRAGWHRPLGHSPFVSRQFKQYETGLEGTMPRACGKSRAATLLARGRQVLTAINSFDERNIAMSLVDKFGATRPVYDNYALLGFRLLVCFFGGLPKPRFMVVSLDAACLGSRALKLIAARSSPSQSCSPSAPRRAQRPARRRSSSRISIIVWSLRGSELLFLARTTIPRSGETHVSSTSTTSGPRPSSAAITLVVRVPTA